MQNLLKFRRKLQNFRSPPRLLKLLNNFRRKGFVLEVIPQNGDFSEYINYVLKNNLGPEFKYFKNILQKGESWGEILLIRNQQNKIVGTLGPNRIEKDEQKRIRAKPGYFSVLPNFRNNGIGTVLFLSGLEKMSKMGASYIEVSVERKNLSAIKVYQNSGMKTVTKKTYCGYRMIRNLS